MRLAFDRQPTVYFWSMTRRFRSADYTFEPPTNYPARVTAAADRTDG